VFVDVLTKLDQYDGRGSFAGWVRSITVTRCLMQLRSPWRRGLRLIASAGPERHSAECEPAARDDSQLGLDLERALDRLGETARLVVWLHDVEGYTHAEIGTLLGGTPSLSKSQLARAHERLRALLEPSGVLHPCTPVSTIC
jgi:RNA polymerase sigma-70 factor (ECF subfamily)